MVRVEGQGLGEINREIGKKKADPKEFLSQLQRASGEKKIKPPQEKRIEGGNLTKIEIEGKEGMPHDEVYLDKKWVNDGKSITDNMPKVNREIEGISDGTTRMHIPDNSLIGKMKLGISQQEIKPYTVKQFTNDSIAFSKEAVKISDKIMSMRESLLLQKSLFGHIPTKDEENEILGLAKQGLKALELAKENLSKAEKIVKERSENDYILAAKKELDMAIKSEEYLNKFLSYYEK